MSTTDITSNRKWEAVIGLEVHAQLATRSKLFCGCSTRFGAEPNHQTCPVCTGMPGTLPVINREAVDLAIRLGLAVGADIHDGSIFARKNYFYPDLPNGYQISQFDKPLCTGGGVWIESKDVERKWVRMTRIHMENDAGKSSHGDDGHSLVDLNRSGVALCEVVSEPDMRSPAEAVAYMKALRSILRYTRVSDGNMEEGSFRCDANISVRPRGETWLGTRTELKNINSFRFVSQALNYEIARHIDVLEAGGSIDQDTRLWDTRKQVSVFMRSKEDAHDYRYFPDPDLLPLGVHDARIEAIRSDLPELADARSARYQSDFGLPGYDAGVLTAERALAEYFEEGVREIGGSAEQVKKLSNWIMGDVLRRTRDQGLDASDIPLRPTRLVQLIGLIDDGVISGKIAKKVFDAIWDEDREPIDVVEERGWKQVSDTGAIDEVIGRILDAHPGEVAEFRGGKVKLRGFFVGQVMREMRGQGNPGLVNERLTALLEDSG
jgi:aspartyl-tRNA(Asn)/glutamyl-tRNA(Gln) amidotransferase subunit B